MLKVHKPRVYRSVQGCCICRAKSSSSRFTDSKRYEQYFKACFHILEPRQSSEICNACVLLTKRFLKLPPESTKDWRHVVDVRDANSNKTAARGAYNSENPKSKKSTRFSRHRRNRQHHHSSHYQDHHHFRNSSDRECSPSALPLGSSASPVPPFLPPNGSSATIAAVDSTAASIVDNHYHHDFIGADTTTTTMTNRLPFGTSEMPETANLVNNFDVGGEGQDVSPSDLQISSFIDLSVWRCCRACCGLLFVHPNGAVIIDQRFWRSCPNHKPKTAPPNNRPADAAVVASEVNP